MRARTMPGRPKHYHRGTKTWVKIGLGLILVDGLVVGTFQAFPQTAIATANLVNFQSNGLGKRSQQTIYSDLNLSKLSELQKNQISFTDSSYVGSVKDITEGSNQNSKLFLQGYVAVPDAGIYQPIYYGTSNTVLANGAGTMKDGQKMGRGNYAISAHNMGSYVNWSVPVPSVSGVFIQPGTYFTGLQKTTPSMIYTTDGTYIYSYQDVDRTITNVGDGQVLSDDYPYTDQTFSYLVRGYDGTKTGQTASIKGLNLGKDTGTDSDSSSGKKVGEYKLSDFNEGDDNTTYTVTYKTDYPYAKYLTAQNFDLSVTNDALQLSGVKAIIQDVSAKDGQVTVSFYLGGDLDAAFSTVGSKLILRQLQDDSYVTLTTCWVPSDQSPSSKRIINTGQLVSKVKVTKAPENLLKLFPDLMKGKTTTDDGSNGVKSLSKVHLSWWQHLVSWLGNFFLAQSQMISNLFGGK